MFLLICTIALFPQDLVNRICHEDFTDYGNHLISNLQAESAGTRMNSLMNDRELMADCNAEASSKDVDFWMTSWGAEHTLLVFVMDAGQAQPADY